MVVFTLFLLLCVFMVAGVAVDAVRFESQRARLQNTLDRAILAAADMSNTMDSDTVVEGYFDKAGLTEYLASVTETESFNSKTVSATGQGDMDTFFMNMVGVYTLAPAAAGTAEESISDIEISMVLDISNSMNDNIFETVTVTNQYGSRTYRNNTGVTKVAAMKNAAKEFVDTIFAGTSDGTTSLSIVPYDSQVNVGQDLLSHYTVPASAVVSNCVNFASADFDSTSIDPDATLTRADVLDVWYRTMPPTVTVCRDVEANRVIPLGSDADDLKTYIDGLVAHGNTSVDLGMKWGTALLDPGTREVVDELIDEDVVSDDFEDRPYDFASADSMKVIVVMTDGKNTSQFILNSAYKTGNSGVYRWWNGSAWRYSVAAAEGSGTSYDGDSTNNEAIRRLNITSGSNMWSSTPEGGASAVQLTYPELWALMSVDYQAYYIRAGAYFKDPWGSHAGGNSNAISSGATTKGNNAYNAWDTEPYTSISATTKDSRQNDICTAAKDAGIIVFAIAFEIDDVDAAKLKGCASSPAHFYDVEGLEITTAFQSIANAIGKLRLTQ